MPVSYRVFSGKYWLALGELSRIHPNRQAKITCAGPKQPRFLAPRAYRTSSISNQETIPRIRSIFALEGWRVAGESRRVGCRKVGGLSWRFGGWERGGLEGGRAGGLEGT